MTGYFMPTGQDAQIKSLMQRVGALEADLGRRIALLEATLLPGQKLYRGSASITITAAAAGTTAVVFPAPFSSAPTVVATLNSGSSTYIAGIGSKTASGFNAIAFHRAGTSTTVTVTADWIAVGPA